MVCARGADHGGTWRFPNAHVLDLPHALLSLLLNLSESPVQSLVTAMDVVGQLGLSQVSIATTRPIE